MPQIAKRPFMAAHNGHMQWRRQELAKKFRSVGGPALANVCPSRATKRLLDR
jgi:hypothetical protein